MKAIKKSEKTLRVVRKAVELMEHNRTFEALGMIQQEINRAIDSGDYRLAGELMVIRKEIEKTVGMAGSNEEGSVAYIM